MTDDSSAFWLKHHAERVVNAEAEAERLRGIIRALLRNAQDDGEFEYEGSARLVVTLRPYRADWKAARDV